MPVLVTLLLACQPGAPADPLTAPFDYEVVLPPAPTDRAVIYLHGSGGDAQTMMERRDESVFLAAGYTVIYPTAPGGMWDIERGQDAARDEVARLVALRDELVDDGLATEVFLAGHSLGASLTWYAACYAPDRFEAFAPIAGTFHEPDAPTACDGGPVALQHGHGLADATVPITGQEELDIHEARQASVYDSIELWVEHNDCDGFAHQVERGPYTCEQYTGCAAPLELCVHEGGHGTPAGWQAETVSFFEDASGL